MTPAEKARIIQVSTYADKEVVMAIRAYMRRLGIAACFLGVGLTAALFFPIESRANQTPGNYSSHGKHGEDFASRTFRTLLRSQKELNLSPEQTDKIEAQAIDYAKTRIRDEAEVKLANVDLSALIRNTQSDLPSIEAALRKSEHAKTLARLDRVKAIRAVVVVLTPKQRDSWRARMKDRYREGRQGRMCRDESGRHEQAKTDG